MESTRLIIVDDHALIRAGIRSLLANVAEFEVVGEASDGVEAIKLVAELRPQVVLTDIAMPNMNGLVVTERIVRDYPEVRVIIVSMHATEEFVGQAVKAGAVGYLLKDTDSAELQFAINAVVRGESYLTPAISKRVMTSYMHLINDTQQRQENPLTPRQREILRLIAEGQSTKAVAKTLDISAKTVETHRSQIMERLSIHDIPGLVRYAMRTGLVPTEKEAFPLTEKRTYERKDDEPK